ncbi:hypothetical protein [uncultured Flavobacterium sp.]|uniref:hypothetical protein n=1 Tax=uncultured Flavobacterium sp. TaxID=165435 RepID=UPI0025FE9FED|nr:hypothetical protein [uncultured Flavobacterium sp.]
MILTFTMSQRMQIFRRAIEILPKRKKKINLLYFNHVPDAHSSDTIIIKYRFTNALYYAIDGKRTFETRHVVIRPDNTKEMKLTVYGFLRKSSYVITVEPNTIYITKTSLST